MLTFAPPAADVKCFHCGESCDQTPIQTAEHTFCCQGCQTVHDLLSQNGLTDYYRIQQNPGVSQKKKTEKERLNYLDDEQIRLRLVDFSDGKMTKISFYLPQIHCASCVWLLEKLPKLHDGILQSKVNYLRKEIFVSFEESKISLRALVALLIDLGYEPLLNLDATEKKKAKKSETQHSNFYIKLGVTGFCFGNIMLLSFPEYLGISDLDAEFIKIFGYLNLLLSLPIFFYGAGGYLRSAYTVLKNKDINIDVPLSLGIFALFGRSAYEILSGTGAGYLDSLGSLIFLLLIGKWFQQKTFDNISFERDYKSYFPLSVTVLKQGVEESIPLSKLEENQVIVVRNGELIPADSILLRGEASIDYSFVTGESAAVACQSGALVYAGGRQQGGIIELQTVKEVSQSYLTRLWNDNSFRNESALELDTQTNRISRYFTLVILLVAIGSGLYWLPTSISLAINTFTATLIIACPCALALNVPFTLGNALRIMARMGFFIKDTNTIERLAKLSHLVFDKTGTITTAGKNQVSFEGNIFSDEEKNAVAALVNISTHPLSQQIGAFLGIKKHQYSVNQFIEKTGEGISGFVNGQKIAIGKYGFVLDASRLAPADKQEFMTKAYVSIGGELKGCFVFRQEFRLGFADLVNRLSHRFKLSLISGDNAGEKARLEKIFPANTALIFNQLPQQKLDYVSQLQAQGAKVAMLGDGLNDAGALRQSDVGIAVAEHVQQFSPACDAILSADRLYLLEHLLAYSRNAIRATYGGFVFSLLYNVFGLAVAVQGDMSPIVAAILMPLSSVTVVGFGVAATWWQSRGMSKLDK